MAEIINFPGAEDGYTPPPECEECGGKLEPGPNMVMRCQECPSVANVMWWPVKAVEWEGK